MGTAAPVVSASFCVLMNSSMAVSRSVTPLMNPLWLRVWRMPLMELRSCLTATISTWRCSTSTQWHLFAPYAWTMLGIPGGIGGRSPDGAGRFEKESMRPLR